MKQHFLWIRYWFEIVAFPAFIFLVIHMSGHGVNVLLKSIMYKNSYNGNIGFVISEILKMSLSIEIISGILLVIFFTWIWHTPYFKKWVPCNHEHCHAESPISHILAIIVLCLHFFAEASIRYMFIQNLFEDKISSTIGIIGFSAHFFVDIIIAIILSLYWKNKKKCLTSIAIITIFWLISFQLAPYFSDLFTKSTEGIIFIFSGFILAMFVHKPHKPVVSCSKCEL